MVERKNVMTIIDNAIEFAVHAHEGEKRKGKKRSYILHPLETMVIVSSITEDEEVIAAAVLHDVVEDAKIPVSFIEKKYGSRVAELVAAESENKREGQSEEETWKIRKEEALTHLSSASRDAKIICLGDKLSNLRELARDYDKLGDQIWERFNQKDKNLHKWYYSEIQKILEQEFGLIKEIEEYLQLMTEIFN